MTATEDLSITMTTASGSVEKTMDELQRVTDRLSHQQLSFDVGGDHPRPAGGAIKITGTGNLKSQLYMDDDVTVQVVDEAGEIVASYDGAVVNVSFNKHAGTEQSAAWVERIHTIKLGD